MREVWNGLDVDFWSREQTMRPKPLKKSQLFYYGDDLMEGPAWWDMLPEIPLPIRFASFKRRLEKALSGV